MSNCAEKHVVITGDGEGIGNAVAEALCRRGANGGLKVVGVSRRPAEEVAHGLPSRFPDTYQHISADLMAEDLAPLIEEILRATQGRIFSLVHVAGAGEIGNDLYENSHECRRMRRMNSEAPVELTSGLQEALDPTGSVVYTSSLAAHPNVGTQFPTLKAYIASKKMAAANLKDLVRERLKIVYPGAYDTAMMTGSIRDIRAPLEWFAACPSNPYARFGIADCVAKRAVTPSHKGPSEISRPLVAGAFVTRTSGETQKKLLPDMIRLSAPSVIERYGLDPDSYNEMVNFHKANENYDPDFPYDSLKFENLHHVLGRVQTAVLRALGLV